MIVELHIIQSFGPSNLNRDDLNQPKECQFGNVRRARISSQCIKRAVRTSPWFTQATQVPIGQRTRLIFYLLRKSLVEAGKPSEQVEVLVTDFVKAYGSKKRDVALDKTNRTDILFYLSQAELGDMTHLMLERWDELASPQTAQGTIDSIVDRLVKDHGNATSAPDIALFGRMLAGRPELNLFAASQYAHAISTHAVALEDDYWTTAEDRPELEPEMQPGAAMLDYLGFNAACYYRYACVDWQQLLTNLNDQHDLARQTVEAFLRASALAVPSGKRTAFAQNCEPAFLLAVVRNDGFAWNLVNAFEEPVKPLRDGGVIAPSVSALEAHWTRLCRKFGQNGVQAVSAWVADDSLELGSLEPHLHDSFDDWVTSVIRALPEVG
ncbi:MAG: type I-E CRISPR-associated protein Cas7/Cse4/CasC [Anaerolineales bacterium]